MEKFLVFPVEEFEQRAQKARAIMEENNIDACVFSKGSNITYFGGYYSYLFDSDFRPFFFVLPLKGEPVLVVPELEKNGALRTSWIDYARTWGIFPQCEALDPITVLFYALRDLNLSNANVAFELKNGQRIGMTQEQLGQLKGFLPDMNIVASDPVVWGCRSIKSPAEVEYLKKSGKANDLGCARAVEAIRAGATEKEVELAMCRGFLEGGAIPGFMTITSGAARNSMANPVASNNVIKHGDLVVMDFGCKYDGYITDVTRGIFVGEVSPRAKQIFDVVVEAYYAGCAAIKPGEPVSAIQDAVDACMKKHGLEDLVLHRAGHSLGSEIHELPSIENKDHTIMQPGMVLALEPALYEYEIGPVRMEDNVVVTETGFEYITNYSRELIIK